MKVIPSVLALGAFVTALVFSPQAARAQDVVEAEPGTALFEQFRPVYHFTPREKLPGRASPVRGQWDNLGVFSGFAMDNAIDGKHTCSTRCHRSPISWKKEYLFGEHVVYATTDDGGKTWQKGRLPARAGEEHDVLRVQWKLGFNFETTIYREMTDEDGELHNVMLFAAEGDPNRYPMWATGSFSGGGCGVEVDPRRDGKNVLIGWITEDNNFTTGQPQGWDGILSVPREVGITIVRDIYDADDHLVGKGDWIVSDSKDVSCADGSAKQSKTIKTLSVKPLSDLQLLRNENALEQVASVSVNGSAQVLNSTGASFELIAEVPEFERGSKVGFEVRRSSAGDEVTTIVYDDAEKKVIIDRSKSSTADCAVFADNDVKPISDSVWGHFYLYDLFSGAAQNDVCEATREKLSFHVFVDVSSVEVFVNGRFSLSARVYRAPLRRSRTALLDGFWQRYV
ncbi:Glycosyl hydrolase, five-bladed beta-propellor domain [Phytophthora cactorum]|nr:Glycosyl hydrolase, five-bladed beta-propellor domain [Phytophthora cactorum]